MSLDLDAIKARCESVPEGPWESDDSEVYDRHRGWVAESLHTDRPRLTAAISNFIAHARSDVPALVAEVERLQGALEAHRDYHRSQQAARDAGLLP